METVENMVTDKIEMPIKPIDLFRAMDVKDSIPIPNGHIQSVRGNYVTGAKRAVPTGEFTTRKMPDGTVRVFRTA